MPFCPNCGKNIGEEDRFCRACGQILQVSTTEKKRGCGRYRHRSQVQISRGLLRS